MDQPISTSAEAATSSYESYASPLVLGKIGSKRRRAVRRSDKCLRLAKIGDDAGNLRILEEEYMEQTKSLQTCCREFQTKMKELLGEEQKIMQELRKKGLAVEDPHLDVEETFRAVCRKRTRKKRGNKYTKTTPCAEHIVCPAKEMPNKETQLSGEKVGSGTESKGHSDTLSKSDEIEHVNERCEKYMGVYSLIMQRAYGSAEEGSLEMESVENDRDLDNSVFNPDSQHDDPYIPPAFAQVFGT